jgi:hypothetical protein
VRGWVVICYPGIANCYIKCVNYFVTGQLARAGVPGTWNDLPYHLTRAGVPGAWNDLPCNRSADQGWGSRGLEWPTLSPVNWPGLGFPGPGMTYLITSQLTRAGVPGARNDRHFHWTIVHKPPLLPLRRLVFLSISLLVKTNQQFSTQ